MKSVIAIVAALSLISNTCFADCDFTAGKGVNKLPDGTYAYSKECHVKVGQTIQDNATKTQQVTDLNKAITLKDLTIKIDETRIQNWSDTSMKLEENLQKVDTLKKQNEWIYFGLGILATSLAASVASNLARKAP